MVSTAPDTSTPKDDLILLAALFLAELSIVVMSISMYMRGDRSFDIFLSSNPGVVFLLAIAGVLLSGAVIFHQYLVRKRSQLHHYRMVVAMNLITVFLSLATIELTLRAVSRSTSQGVKLLSIELLPKHWEQIALHHRRLLGSESGKFDYVVYDDLMGWTVGVNKQGSDGMYWSSSEGVRAPRAGVNFGKSTGRPQIAIVGDSFTFGQDVQYEDTWGYYLEKMLDSKFQVLNFGVPGYAIDQAYLRYEKDILKWKPKIVIFGFIANDVIRSMSVYPFIKFPAWDWPYSKPRFIIHDGSLKRINVPPVLPEAVFSRGSVSELLFLEYDGGYKQDHWQKNLLRKSYLTRLFISKFPRWTEVNRNTSNEALVLINARILKDFVRSAKQNGVIPIVTYFPSKVDLASPSVKRVLTESDIAKQVLEEADIPYTDLTPCVLELSPDDRFVPSKSHYSPEANAAVANCLHNVVTEALAQAS